MLGASLTYRVGSLPAQKRRTGARHVARVPLLAWRRPLPAHGLRSTPWITPHPRGQSCIAVSQGGAAWGDDVSSTDAAPPLPGQRRAARTSAAGGASRDRMAAAAAITSSYGGGGAASSPSSGGGSRIGGLSALVGASAQQLLSSAMHSLDVFEHRELQTLDSDTDTLGDESLEELNGSGAAQPAHIVKANYEARARCHCCCCCCCCCCVPAATCLAPCLCSSKSLAPHTQAHTRFQTSLSTLKPGDVPLPLHELPPPTVTR
jgi:hypothetical protein